MSAPQEDAPGRQEEKKGLGKYVSRVKNILRGGGESGKRLSLFSTRGPTDPSASTAAATSLRSAAAVTTATVAPPPPPLVSAEQDMARRLAERWNIELEPEDWRLLPAAERVEKHIRMRIHRTCHKCKTPFGANKVCVTCNHPRCAECPRYPPKRVSGKGKRPEGQFVGPPPDINRAGNYKITGEGMEALEAIKNRYRLTMPSKTGGQELVRKMPMQRVRRTCHQCQTLFWLGVKICDICGHIRCADCARDPPKKHKYPYGYPGDAESEPRRYTCHNCQTIFATEESTCSSCEHEKCPECPRATVGRKNPDTHPDVIRRVEEKLAAMRMPSEPARLPATQTSTDPPPTATEAGSADTS